MGRTEPGRFGYLPTYWMGDIVMVGTTRFELDKKGFSSLRTRVRQERIRKAQESMNTWFYWGEEIGWFSEREVLRKSDFGNNGNTGTFVPVVNAG